MSLERMKIKLKIGFIVDEDCISNNYNDLLAEINSDNAFFATPILISQRYNHHKQYKRKPFFAFIKNIFIRILRRLIMEVEFSKLKKNKIFSNYGTSISLENNSFKKISIYPLISKSGHTHSFSEKDIKKINDLELDVLIRCGKGILSGKILHSARFGVLSFHHGDNREIRGLPSGFWEVFLSKPSTGFIIQQLTEQLDVGKVIYRGNIPTASYWHLNSARINLKSNNFMLQVLRSISSTGTLPPIEKNLQYSNKIFFNPGLATLLIYIFKQLKIFILNNIFNFLGYRHDWNVSFIKSTNFNIQLSKSLTINNPPNRFLADPFLIDYEGVNYCFVEDFCYKKNIGKISCYKIFEDSYEPLGIVLEENFHLSFPYIFEFNGEIYMCPETAQAEEIRLYKSTKFPYEWTFEKTLIKNIAAVDTVIFEDDGIWFLLTNTCSGELNERNSELHLYYADNPLSEKWVKSPENPIIFDSQKARNGGFFIQNNKKYRVNQIHAKARYGVGFSINLIKKISTKEYIETEVSRVDPTFFPNLSGTHHFHANENFIAFDHSSFNKIA
ncbi:hypothetical protein N9507_00530 [Gammaproteobacteria bacterium]|jgi:hypothetical protein|nr:hypothetical protein [Gammaproteobacteria bacterium]